jgi:hypothetical protein
LSEFLQAYPALLLDSRREKRKLRPLSRTELTEQRNVSIVSSIAFPLPVHNVSTVLFDCDVMVDISPAGTRKIPKLTL